MAEATAGDVTKVALTEIPDQRVVTALRTGEGNLKLIAWDVSNPVISRRQGDDDEPLTDNTAGPIREVSITAWEPDAFTVGDDVAVAVRTNAGDLKIISWAVLPSGDFTRSGDSGDLAGAADLVNISWSRISKRLVTAIRDGDNNLRLITWRGY